MASIVREYILQDLTAAQEDERRASMFGPEYGPEHPQYDPPRPKDAVYVHWTEPVRARISKIKAAAEGQLVCDAVVKSGARKGQACGKPLQISVVGWCSCSHHESYRAVIKIINGWEQDACRGPGSQD